MTHNTKQMPAEACSEFLTDDSEPPELDQGPEMLGRLLLCIIVVASVVAVL